MTKPSNVFVFFLLLGLFVSPFFFWPHSTVAYEVPKVNIIRIWIELLIFLGIIRLRKVNFIPKSDSLTNYLVIGFLAVVILTSLVGADRIKSFVGNYYRNDGIFTLSHLVAFYLLFTFFKIYPHLKKILFVIALSALLLSFWSLLVWFKKIDIFKTTVWPDGGIGLGFGNPNFLSGYLLVTLPFVVYLLIKTAKRMGIFLLPLAVILPVTAIILTRARAGVLGIIVTLFLSVFIFSKVKLYKLLSGAFLVTIAFLSLYFLKLEAYSRNIIVAESRQRILQKGIIAFAQRPVTGYGWANFDYAFESVDWPIHIGSDVYVDKAHSGLMETLVTTGIVGFLLYVGIIIVTIKNLYGAKRNIYKYLLLVFLVLLIHEQIQVVSISEELLFWLIVGVSTTAKSQKPTKVNWGE